MKTQLFRILAVSTALLGLTLTTAYAETERIIKVTVPFAFVVNNQKLPAGEYRIQESGNGSLLLIQSVDAKNASTVITGFESPSVQNEPKLVFQKDNGEVYLTHVQLSGSPMHFVYSKANQARTQAVATLH